MLQEVNARSNKVGLGTTEGQFTGRRLEEVKSYVYLDHEVRRRHIIQMEIAYRRAARWHKFYSIIDIRVEPGDL